MLASMIMLISFTCEEIKIAALNQTVVAYLKQPHRPTPATLVVFRGTNYTSEAVADPETDYRSLVRIMSDDYVRQEMYKHDLIAIITNQSNTILFYQTNADRQQKMLQRLKEKVEGPDGIVQSLKQDLIEAMALLADREAELADCRSNAYPSFFWHSFYDKPGSNQP